MEILALLEKYLGQNDFNPAIAGLLNKRDSEYHLTFYKVVVNEDKIPKDEYEHMDKKLARINEFQRVLERDVKEFKRFIDGIKSSRRGHGTALEDGPRNLHSYGSGREEV